MRLLDVPSISLDRYLTRWLHAYRIFARNYICKIEMRVSDNISKKARGKSVGKAAVILAYRRGGRYLDWFWGYTWDTRSYKTKSPTGEGWAKCLILLVARGGIEPPTQGFSILCSTD
jgi:hypothetical protein